MFRLLRNYTKDGWWAAVLGPILTIIEVIVDAFIPLVMSDIIDVGIYKLGGDMNYIISKGIQMVILAVLGGSCARPRRVGCGHLVPLVASATKRGAHSHRHRAMRRTVQLWHVASRHRLSHARRRRSEP